MNIFWITFYNNQEIIKNNKNNDGLNERQKKTLNLIIKKPGIQIKALSKELNIPIDTLDRYVKIFVNKKIIERKGSKKTGGYYIKNKNK